MAKKNITEKNSDEIIAYKVIDSDTRFGTNYSIFCWENPKSSFSKIIKQNPKIKNTFEFIQRIHL